MGPHTHTCKQTFLKRSVLLYWDIRPLSWKYWLEKKTGHNAKYGLQMRPGKEQAAYLYSGSLASYKYWKKDTGGRGNGQMVRLRNGTPELCTEYHLLLSDLIPFDQNNCHLHRYHQFCHLQRRQCHSPSHQGFFSFKGEIFGSDQMHAISVQKIMQTQPSESSPYLLL